MLTDVVDEFPDPAIPELSYQVMGLDTREQILSATLEMLSRLIPADGAVWNAVDIGTGKAEVYSDRSEYRDPVVSETLMRVNDHPMIISYLSARGWQNAAPRRISDLTDRRTFHRTHTYNDLFRPLATEHQMTVLTSRVLPFSGRCWSFNRSPGSPDFSDAERDLLGRLQPVLAAIDRGVPAGDRSDMDAGSTPRLTAREIDVLSVTAQGFTATACGHLLRIAERTVRKHLENAYAKLGCHDRTTAVLRARALGLLHV